MHVFTTEFLSGVELQQLAQHHQCFKGQSSQVLSYEVQLDRLDAIEE